MGDIMEMLASALRMTIPVLITALGAIYSERSGVTNIGLEGMMMTGAFWGAYGALHYGPVGGFLLAIAMGMLVALIHAVVTVTYRVDQIVSGVAINILAYGLARFFSIALFGMATTSPSVNGLPKIDIPLLKNINALKPIATDISPIIILGILLVFITYWVLERTVFGLRLKAVGENPLAADTLGVKVIPYRYLGVIISGAFAGLAGAYLSIEHTHMYVEGMTQGKGFIALAAMIFGNWMPFGSFWASFLFGFAEAISMRVVQSKVIPYQFIKMIPYLLTLLVLAGVVRKAQPPASVGIPYSREGD
ncbi:ABC transporter permease [Carboxydothermus pertinax]|uniref:Putative sugar ABC transporter, permease protein n=1 Tax=Carboxydothermus pertinax TaxID=870242 RepID=A0A1L8CXW4_9THEO|nr:ABC transporter permease [Carboxydothermus pertinax]GAV23775.1 putative sugar ABC transporter, permease protein [Carboxydothermus pertinax]